MGKKGGKKKDPGQGGPPDQGQAGQPARTAQSQPSVSGAQPAAAQGQAAHQGGGQARGGFGRGGGAPGGQQPQLPSALGGQGQRDQTPRQDAPRQQPQQPQHPQQQQQPQRPQQQQQQPQQQQQGRGGGRGRGGGGRGQGRGGGYGRGQGPRPDSQQQQQQFPPVGQPQQSFPTLGQPSQKPAWGKSASQPTQPTAAAAASAAPQQVPQTTGSSASEAAVVQEIATQMSTISLEGQASASTPDPAKQLQLVPTGVLKIPKRKNPLKAGTTGKPIKVMTNMMAINFKNFKCNIVHYDVSIEPDKPKCLMRAVFKAAQQKLFKNRHPAFDGKKNAFSAGFLPIENNTSTEVTVYNEDGKEKVYKITFKVANDKLDLSWLTKVAPGMVVNDKCQIGLQALDIILRSAPAISQSVTTVGRSFFTPPPGEIVSLGGGMDVWVGLFQSAVLGWKPFLNVDVAHKGFPSPMTVIDVIKTICDDNRRYNDPPSELTPKLIDNNKDAINRFLKGLKVVYEIPGQATSRRTQRVNGLVTCPRENSFELDGQTISIENYYKLAKKYNIRYPLFPCLWVGGRDKNIHVPVELCRLVAGQATQKKLNENQTTNMIKFAATGTNDRKAKIMNAYNHMRHNDNPCMKEFGISVSGEFETVNARILDPPTLSYQALSDGKFKPAFPAKGVWRPEKFYNASASISTPNSWTILSLNQRTRDQELYHLFEGLRQAGDRLGMVIGKPATPFTHLQLRGADTRALQQFFEKQKAAGLKLIVVVVPDMKGPYSRVKQTSELTVGILTQCLKGRTLTRLNDTTSANILLKINAKLNGINHRLDTTQLSFPICLTKPCMIVGADVTHPSPDAMDIPSIAAVAASHDPAAFKYNIEIRLQPPRMEIIQDLAEIMRIQLVYFYKKTGFKPLRIIFYRDGVSEGQFAQVMAAELTAVRAACTKLEANYKPAITFLVVQKRHHTRFFPMNPNDRAQSDDRNGNVKAGTIVDTEITHPSDIDFYLVSHASIQGTARPTKYRCLHDDSSMTENEIEQLTYFLCHMFSRCTRSVSYPTPTYYAHLAAFRARALTQDVNINLNNLQREQLDKLSLQEAVYKDTPMFFV